MQLRIKCDCGGKILCHSQAPIPFWFCDSCSKIYTINELKLPEKEEEKEKVFIEKHEHQLVCTICNLKVICE